MKKIILLFSLFGLIVSCADTKPCDEPTNGFITGTNQTVMLGSEATVEVFKTIDKAWLKRLLHIKSTSFRRRNIQTC